MEIETDPFDRIENGPGDWFTAGYDGICSKGGEPFSEGDTIRADGEGEWECYECIAIEGEWGI